MLSATVLPVTDEPFLDIQPGNYPARVNLGDICQQGCTRTSMQLRLQASMRHSNLTGQTNVKVYCG